MDEKPSQAPGSIEEVAMAASWHESQVTRREKTCGRNAGEIESNETSLVVDAQLLRLGAQGVAESLTTWNVQNGSRMPHERQVRRRKTESGCAAEKGSAFKLEGSKGRVRTSQRMHRIEETTTSCSETQAAEKHRWPWLRVPPRLLADHMHFMVCPPTLPEPSPAQRTSSYDVQ